jgi:alkaline phosphatase D
VFVSAPSGPASPAEGHQYFGHVAVDGTSRVMTVTLRDLDGRVLFGVDLDPA